MVFKRRDRRSFWRIAWEFIYPRGGWQRAFYYMRHRVRRLPDSPEKIARGIFAGVFAAFTPFYGIHFVIAGVLAKIMNGNFWAALAGTFIGNPLTYLPIGVISLKVGHFMMGTRFDEDLDKSLVAQFSGAAEDLLRNFLALFTDVDANWSNLIEFYDRVFLPYLVGGVAPGVIAGLIAYYLSVPVIAAYQKHRRARLRKKLAERRAEKAARQAAEANAAKTAAMKGANNV
ncbi:DUF2062 domain-containing protein [Actibacterium sp. XHP0104]|uniref:DUF2062 domain-containing protein n=1 Tax=Actibacterium sp. XHP0104 TaxID=2984335 RepID=UPI0021E80159|nr:DUF2062 domain-containing protein [Actibacterium sp. XHP0104]MCV2881611.1 DUF2062 domain-containing protein [Actibacterium sp. XHP0104]